MRKATALALALASAGSAALVLSQDHWTFVDRLLYGDKNSITSTSAPLTVAAGRVTSEPAGRVFSSSQPLLREPAGRSVTADRKPDASAAPSQTANAAPAMPFNADPTVRRLASSRPADDDARRELVKDLQRELKRVGCFEGDVSGSWRPSSKKAMAAFTDRVNATLPLDEPDYILLTLVQGHGDKACGMGCPGGQALDDGGKCVPRAILAHNVRRGTGKGAAVARQDDAEQRLTKPVTRVQQRPATVATAPPKIASGWSTVVTTPTTSEAPAQAPAAPLPGRMAIGAPADNATQQPDPAGATRKAALAAAALAMRRAVEAETERQNRQSETPARKSDENVDQPAARRSVAALTTPPAPAPRAATVIAPTASVETPAAPEAPARADAKRAISSRVERKSNEPTPQAQRFVIAPARQPAPRMVPPYAVGRVLASAPPPAYAPQPTRWTRTIFNDIGRMR